jgi:hypothetical protein
MIFLKWSIRNKDLDAPKPLIKICKQEKHLIYHPLQPPQSGHARKGNNNGKRNNLKFGKPRNYMKEPL